MLRASIEIALVLAATPLLAASAYLCLLSLLSRRTPAPAYGPAHLRFDVIVPAHDEEAGVAATVASLLAMDYPASLRRVIVVADNCRDATADRARDAGATVFVRRDAGRRGKGYALQHAFAQSLADGFADAVVVVDADTTVSPNLLGAFAARLDAGARAVQAHYGVSNPDASWRTRLMTVAFALFHGVRSLGRERLRCSSGLRGNGMCFASSLLRDVPHDAFSVVEDVEYGIRLGLAGHRVHYAAEAVVLGEMVSSADRSRSQRRRWEGGRMSMVREHGIELVRCGIAERSIVLLDLALDLFVPPLSLLAAAVAAGTSAALLASLAAGHVLIAAWLWGASLATLTVYVARGWWISGTGLKGLEGMLHAPAYLLWKLGLTFGHAVPGAGVWVRTPRERGA